MARYIWLFILSFFVSSSSYAEEAAKTFTPPKLSQVNASFFQYVYNTIRDIWNSIAQGFASLDDFWETAEWFSVAIQGEKLQDQVGDFLFEFAIALTLAIMVERLLNWWLKPHAMGYLSSRRHNIQKLLDLGCAVLLRVAPILAFTGTLYGVFRIMDPVAPIYLSMVDTLASGLLVVWSLLHTAHLFLCPTTVDHQHIPLRQEVLNETYSWIRISGLMALASYYLIKLGALIDLPPAGHKFLWQITGFIFASITIYWMGVLRQDVIEWIRIQRQHNSLSRLRRSMLPYLEYGFIPAVVLVIISYVSWVTKDHGTFQKDVWKSLLTLAIFPTMRYFAYLLRCARVLYLRRSQSHNTLTKQLLTYSRQIDFLLVSLCHLGAFIIALDLWNVGLYAFIQSEWGQITVEKILSILLIIFLALVTQKAFNEIYSKYLHFRDVLGTENLHREDRARIETLTRVVRNIMRLLVWVPAVLFILTELDIDVWPALVAIGPVAFGLTFGFQEVVKDFVAGFFMLLENTFSIGDVVTINGQTGTVESMSIRTLRLRATNGDLFTYRFGQMTTIANSTREFSTVVIKLAVSGDANIDQVCSVIEKTQKDLMKDKAYKAMVKQDLIIDGVTNIDDHSIEIRARVKVGPAQKFGALRIFNKALKENLRQANVPMAVPLLRNFNSDVA